MTLFPSTRTDYLDMNEKYAPLADVHVRRAISYAIDRKAIVKSVLFGYGTPANSFLPPQVPFYEQERAAACSSTWRKAKAEMAKSKYPKGFKVTLLVGAGAQVEAAMGQILQNQLKQLGINVTFKQEDTSTEFHDIEKQKYQLGFSYWTMDIADPDELVTFAIDPKRGGAHSFYTDYNNPTVIEPLAPGAAGDERREAGAALHEAPADRGARRVPGLPLLLAVPLGVHEQAPRLLRVPARQLPPGGRLARVARARDLAV